MAVMLVAKGKHVLQFGIKIVLFLTPIEAARLYAFAAAIYFSSRLLVILALNCPAIDFPLWKGDMWESGAQWYDNLLRWDSEWYTDIAAHGYHYNGDPNDRQPVVFYPLYPLIAQLVASIAGISVAHALLIVANLAAILAVLLLCKLARQDFGDKIALLSVAFLSFFPGSLFLSAGYTKSLALLLILCCFTALKTRRYVFASAFAGLAVATRSAGIVLLPVLLWEIWLKFGTDRRKLVLHAISCVVIATSGLWSYMIYLGAAFGHPLAFADGQAAWHGSTSLGSRLVSGLILQPFWHLRFTDFTPPGLDQWFFILFLVLSALAWRRLSSSQSLFMLGILMLPYLSLSGGPSGLSSMARFGLLAFPAFIILGVLCRRTVWLYVPILGVFAAMLGLYTALFAQWYWIG